MTDTDMADVVDRLPRFNAGNIGERPDEHGEALLLWADQLEEQGNDLAPYLRTVERMGVWPYHFEHGGYQWWRAEDGDNDLNAIAEALHDHLCDERDHLTPPYPSASAALLALAEAVRKEEGPLVYVNTYDVTRRYGGPEEGGWWYDEGELLWSQKCQSEDEADEERASLVRDLPRGRRVCVESHPGENFPRRKPHYE